jgi:hypothetical protein
MIRSLACAAAVSLCLSPCVSFAESETGHLAASELAPIYHPTFKLYLRKDAAEAWSALRDHCRAHGIDIFPKGALSAYRTFEEQVEMKKKRGIWAKTPGRSLHGLGIAVDIPIGTHPKMLTAIHEWGAAFGWAAGPETWSDAPKEAWHVVFKPGVWKSPKPEPVKSVGLAQALEAATAGIHSGAVASSERREKTESQSAPARKEAERASTDAPGDDGGLPLPPLVLRPGSQGAMVKKLQSSLVAAGHPVEVDGQFGPETEAAVRAFQESHALPVDGIAGLQTWHVLEAAPKTPAGEEDSDD